MRLIHGDCIDKMQKLAEEDIKVDLILTDPPYGTTACKWDSVIPFEEMWDCIKQLRNPTTPILLFGTEPFSSNLRMSNIKEYRYDWVWDKENGTGFLNANKMPLKSYELISVFYHKLPVYNPQMRYVGVKRKIPPKRKKQNMVSDTNRTYGEHKQIKYVDDGYRYPLDIIHCNKTHTEAHNSIGVHPTQKPVKLLEYLIKTYTNPNDTVLDFTMGSGSTGIACQNLNRDFIGIELDKDYYDIAVERIKENGVQKKLI
jgi:site-specific DNA-methyltransferase (adenine-specific)